MKQPGKEEKLKKKLEEARRELASYRIAAERVGEHLSEIARLNQELSRSQREKALILSSSSDAMRLIDRDCNTIWANAAMEKFIGGEAGSLEGKKCYEVIRTTRCGTPECLLRRALDEGRRITDEVTVEIGGEKHICIASGTPFRNEQGEVRGILEDFIDITGHRKAEEAMITSEHEKTMILESIRELVIFQDTKHRVLWVNRASAESVNSTSEELAGRYCYRIWHGANKPCVGCPLEKAMKTKCPEENEITSPDGRTWQVRGYPVLDQEEKVVGAVEIVEDITERKRYEKELLRHALVYQSMQEAVLIFAPDGTIVDVNPATEKLYGWPRRELLGKKAEMLNPPERAEEITADILKGLKKEGVWSGEIPIITRSGRKLIMSTVICSLRDREGNWLGNIGINRDVTERKQVENDLRSREEQLRAQYKSIPVPTYTWKKAGDDFVLVNFNDAAVEITGGNIENFAGQKLGEMYRERPIIIEDIHRCYAEKSTIEREMPHRLIATGEDWFLAVKYAFVPPDLVLAHTEDITDRKRMEAELLKTQKIESLGILAGGIAHDFNNILMLIMGNISLAKLEIPPDSKVFGELSNAEGACIQAKRLTQQLLTFSRGGKPVVEVASLPPLIKDAVALSLSGSNVGSSFSFPRELWSVKIDKGQIYQAVNNLVINAVQAMPEGGEIEVSAENITLRRGFSLPLEPGRYVRLSIKDTGVGIPRRHLTKIYDPFFTTKQKGSGLGLTIAYSIVKKHGGVLAIRSDEKNGTTASIYLPALEKKIESEEEEKEDIPRGRGKILLMDDQENIRRVAARMARSLGYEVRLAREGGEAVELYRKAKKEGGPFDAVILDLTVRGKMGGKEAMEKLLEFDPEVRAIVSSGYSMNAVLANYKRHGFKGIINKPYRLRELGQVLRGVLDGK